jgi:hypothetical protein
VSPSATSTSPVTTPPAQRRMRGPSARQVISPAFASWTKLHDTSLTPTLMYVMIHPLSLSLRVVELKNVLCNEDKLLCKVFRENKKLNLELKSASSEIVSLRSTHDDMSAKPCDKCNMIMINYADLWLVHSRIASLLDGARLELRELKARSTLVGACTTYPLLRSDLEVVAVEIKDLKHKLDHSSRYTILSPICEACVSLKGKLFHATKENAKL